MLEFIRKRAHGWLAWLIVLAIIIPFALWGIQQYVGGGGDTYVAKVDGVEISQQQLQRAYLQQRQRLQEMLGENFRPELFPEEVMKQQLVEELIRTELLVQGARDAGLRIGDRFLAEAIRQIPAFQGEEGFSSAQYRQVLARQGMTPALFENLFRRDLLARQFYSGLSESAFVTDAEVDAYAGLREQKRTFGYFVLPVSRFESDVQVGEEEIQQYYQDNSAAFMVPERVRIAYLQLSLDELAKGIEVPEEELRQRYEASKENYREPEQRKARHILIKVPEDASNEAVEKARQKAEDIRQQLAGGAAFEVLAREHSDDPGSAKKGGDLGFFGKGAMVKPFEETAFSLTLNEISDPVRSQFGFHIIQVQEVRGGELKPFGEVREQILRDIRQEKAQQLFYDKADELANLTYEHPDTLEVAASQLELKVEEAGPFSRQGGAGIAANPKVTGAAFSTDVLERGNNSEVLELSDGQLVVLRVREHLPEEQRPLDEVKGQIAETLKRERARQLAKDAAAEALAQIEGGTPAEQVAKKYGAQWKRESVGREAAGIPAELLRAMFRMPHPQDEKRRVEQVSLASGDQALAVLYEVIPGDPTKLTNEQRSGLRSTLADAKVQASLEAVLDGLRSRADVEITGSR